jgi:hypothetical protein
MYSVPVLPPSTQRLENRSVSSVATITDEHTDEDLLFLYIKLSH